MCIVSMIGDDYTRGFPSNWPGIAPSVIPQPGGGIRLPEMVPTVTREEFDKLKKEVESLKKLLEAAKAYDEETGQADCEVDEKVQLIRKIAEIVGVDFTSVFGDKNS